MQLISMVIELAIGIVSALAVCDGAIIYDIVREDYNMEKAAKRVRSFKEYLSKGFKIV